MQRALDPRSGRRLQLFRLLGDQHLFGRGHHRTDGSRLGLGLSPAVSQICSPHRLLFGPSTRFRQSLFPRFGLRTGHRRCRFGLLLAGFRLVGGHLSLLGLFLARVGVGALLGFAFTTLAVLPLAPHTGELVFLSADRFRLLAGFLFAARQVGIRCRWRGHRVLRIGLRRGVGCRGRGCLGSDIGGVVAFDKGALLAHFDLDRSGLAAGVSLLDLAGRFLRERDLAAGCGGAMAGLQIAKQLLLVGFGQDIGRGHLGNPGRLQLVEQGVGGLLEFGRELSYGGT